jgi:hypothetical protein
VVGFEPTQLTSEAVCERLGRFPCSEGRGEQQLAFELPAAKARWLIALLIEPCAHSVHFSGKFGGVHQDFDCMHFFVLPGETTLTEVTNEHVLGSAQVTGDAPCGTRRPSYMPTNRSFQQFP